MEAVILIGVPAAGKSTFFKQKFADTHVRINGDMLRNRGLEWDILKACLRHGHPFVVDKMNFSFKHRGPYLEAALRAGFLRVGYLLDCSRSDALRRNKNEDRKEKNLPEAAIHNAFSHLDWPCYHEGFDRIHYVTMDEKRNRFNIGPWKG